MDFISNQKAQIEAMLATLQIKSIDDLFDSIPKNLLLDTILEDDGLSESEGLRLMENIASENKFQAMTSYLGAGAYEHHLPALVNFICSKSEFLTAYTPYQPEASQGTLQAIFEYQSVIASLTGMSVSNASLYDGATACAEALLMALRHNKERNKVVIAQSLHPHYRAVVEQFLSVHQTKIEWIPFNNEGQINQEEALKIIDDTTACVLLQYPNFFGVIDDIKPISFKAKTCGALTVICANPLVYGLYENAHELFADIAVGDTQPFGLPLQFGGPYLGYLACTVDLMRQIPGRIVGETIDLEGKRGFVLTLQAREQHIRREKATSNICTNQALASLATLVAILWYGKEGVHKLALTNYQRTAYLRSSLAGINGIKIISGDYFFNEFVVSFGCPYKDVETHFNKFGIVPGLDLSLFYPEFKSSLLIAVTEIKGKEDLDKYIEVAKSLVISF